MMRFQADLFDEIFKGKNISKFGPIYRAHITITYYNGKKLANKSKLDVMRSLELWLAGKLRSMITKLEKTDAND